MINAGKLVGIRVGERIVYNDRRDGHANIVAVVLEIHPNFMIVQFKDRADTTKISFSDRQWMDFLDAA
jgi:hypothetical protein